MGPDFYAQATIPFQPNFDVEFERTRTEKNFDRISTKFRRRFWRNAILAKFIRILTRSKSGRLSRKANFDVEIWSKSSRNGRKYFDQNLLKLTKPHLVYITLVPLPAHLSPIFSLLLKNFSIFQSFKSYFVFFKWC